MFHVQMSSMQILLLSLLLSGSLIQSAEGTVQVTVTEDSHAVLPCSLSTKENMETSVFHWKKDGLNVFLYDRGDYYGHGVSGQDKQFEGRVSHFNEDLKNGNASIKIRKTKMADSGVYTCIFPRLQPRQQFSIALFVVGSGFSVGSIIAAAVAVTFFGTLLIVLLVLAVLVATGRISCRKDEEKGEPIRERAESDLLAE